jgi:Type I restriction-modification system methyltransferase subunit
VQSLAAAAKLLDNVFAGDGVRELFAELGFAHFVTLEEAEAASIGLPAESGPFSIAQGTGAVRALIFRVKMPVALRHEVSRIASRLVARAPHLLWIIAASSETADEFAIAACDAGHARSRVAALVVKPGSTAASDAETVCSLAAARFDSDLLVHSRWLEILGRDSVGRRFFRALETSISHLAADLSPAPGREDAAELALLNASRLIFLSFLETKGWLDRDHGFLGNQYADCMMRGGGYHRKVLTPLFFGTLNTHPKNRSARARHFGRVPFLNGGLFSRSSLERRHANATFSDEAIGALFADVLARYRFTAREDNAAWSETAIDPEMLGRTFESLMSATVRKKSGSFYTPQSLVAQLTRSALSNGLSSALVPPECVARALSGEQLGHRQAHQLLCDLDAFRLLDPACGSGAFLVHALEELSALRRNIGDARPPHEIRRQVLTHSMFGVDVNPTAVWLCELRLWLCMAIEDPETDPMRVSTLPNLDRHIRVGDSLLADSFGESDGTVVSRKFTALRLRYSRATGPRKQSLGRMLDRAERQHAIRLLDQIAKKTEFERRDLLCSVRSRDLFGERARAGHTDSERLLLIRTRLRDVRRRARDLARGAALPFSFATHFADVAAGGGFHVVIGNPPGGRTHNLEQSAKAALRSSFFVYRNAAWKSGSDAAAAGRGFAGQVDVAALFVERCVSLTQKGGISGLIVPAKLWRSLAGGGARALLLEKTELVQIDDLSEGTQPFDAAVYPSIFVTRRVSADGRKLRSLSIAVSKNTEICRWQTCASRIAFDDTSGSPWVMLPPEVRDAFDCITAAGIPLARSSLGRPMLGVKSGCNNAFTPSDGAVEPELLRPLIRGEDMIPWRIPSTTARILWTHDETGRPLRTLPPRATKWLSQFRNELEGRSDQRGGAIWWSLFRIESADFSRPGVVWSDVARTPTAALIPAGDTSVAINSCYVIRCTEMCDALALTALLNSPLSAAWLNVIAEPARGGYHPYLGWTMSLLPGPRNWKRASMILAAVTRAALDGSPPSKAELVRVTLDAFELKPSSVEALLRWDEK